MSLWKRLVGRPLGRHQLSPQKPPAPREACSSDKRLQPTTPHADANAAGATGLPTSAGALDVSAEWHQFFENAPLHAAVWGPLVAYVGSWPKGLDPNLFSSSSWPAIVRRVREYVAMPYPVAAFRDFSSPPRPNYRMVGGQVSRVSNQFMDLHLCSASPEGGPAGAEPELLVMRLIQRYAEWPLAKLIFLLPKFQDLSEHATSGKPLLLVNEDIQIQVYMGVENLLWGVWEDLPSGGRLSDESIRHKLSSLLIAPD